MPLSAGICSTVGHNGSHGGLKPATACDVTAGPPGNNVEHILARVKWFINLLFYELPVDLLGLNDANGSMETHGKNWTQLRLRPLGLYYYREHLILPFPILFSSHHPEREYSTATLRPPHQP